MQRHRSLRDILSGLIFIGIAAAFGWAATGYEIGTAFRMGPGYFPLVLAGVLGMLGVAICVKGFGIADPDDPLGRLPVRGILLLLGAIVFFGLTVRGLGLVPSLFVAVFAAALASRQNTVRDALMTAVALTVLSLLVFTYALSVPLALFGPWTGL